jgi:hypothetical protein
MPVLYGHDPISGESISHSDELTQYTKWCALKDCSFSLTYKDATWQCRVWSGESFISSDQHEEPVLAMHQCYSKMRTNGKG